MSSSTPVSIIIPAYNQATFLAETIDSVVSQQYPACEVIVLDDGSTDSTPTVLRTYGDRVTALRHDNIGENATVNRGLDMANGKILCIVNADDPLLPGAIEAAVRALASDPRALAAYPDWAEIDPVGNLLRTVLLPEYDVRGMLMGFNVSLGPGVFLRREALRRIGKRNPALRYTGDLDYWIRLALHGGLRHIPEVLATHRVHPRAASSTSQGRSMAAELIRLVTESVRNPAFPLDCRPYRLHFLTRAHDVATHFCGADRAAQRRHKTLARWYRLLSHVRLKCSRLPPPEGGALPRVIAATAPLHYSMAFTSASHTH